MIAEALAAARRAGASGLVTVRAESAFYLHDVVAAIRRGGAHFSITARMDKAVVAAISRIPEQAWAGIKYPAAIWDEDEQRWVSDAEVAEIGYTAFTSRRKAEHVAARLLVRRLKRLNPASAGGEQDALFTTYRHDAVFTDSPLAMLSAEATHRDHAGADGGQCQDQVGGGDGRRGGRVGQRGHGRSGRDGGCDTLAPTVCRT